MADMNYVLNIKIIMINTKKIISIYYVYQVLVTIINNLIGSIKDTVTADE